MVMGRAFTEIRQEDAKHILRFYNDNIILRLQKDMNEAAMLAQVAYAMNGSDAAWLENAAAPLPRTGKRCVMSALLREILFDSALPADTYGGQVGHGLKDFSYIYTMAKVVKELVVEGPFP